MPTTTKYSLRRPPVRNCGTNTLILFHDGTEGLPLPLCGIAMTVQVMLILNGRRTLVNKMPGHCEDPDEIGRRSNLMIQVDY
jgi:hypothetical protein